jgi:hypothetical protein
MLTPRRSWLHLAIDYVPQSTSDTRQNETKPGGVLRGPGLASTGNLRGFSQNRRAKAVGFAPFDWDPDVARKTNPGRNQSRVNKLRRGITPRAGNMAVQN